MTREKLTRSNDKIIAGVCAGLADYFGLDPAIVRIGYLLLSILSAGFPGVLVYIILWTAGAGVPPPAAGSRPVLAPARSSRGA